MRWPTAPVIGSTRPRFQRPDAARHGTALPEAPDADRHRYSQSHGDRVRAEPRSRPTEESPAPRSRLRTETRAGSWDRTSAPDPIADIPAQPPPADSLRVPGGRRNARSDIA